MPIGEKIQHLRKSHHWSQEELASRISVSRQALSKWELGSAVPDTENVVQLSKLFAVSTDYLLLDEHVSDRPAVHRSERHASAALKRAMPIRLSFHLILWPSIGLFILALVSVFKPHQVMTNTRTYDGFIGFLMGNRLMWLFYPLVMMLLAGVLIALFANWLPVLQASRKIEK